MTDVSPLAAAQQLSAGHGCLEGPSLDSEAHGVATRAAAAGTSVKGLAHRLATLRRGATPFLPSH